MTKSLSVDTPAGTAPATKLRGNLGVTSIVFMVVAAAAPLTVVGGVIPPGDFDELYEAGATAIFPPGTVIADAAIGLLQKLADRLGYQLSQ